MSSLYITEYERLGRDCEGNVMQCGMEPAVASQVVSYTGTAGTSSALNVRTHFVRLKADADFNLKVGTNPTAVTTDPEYEANVEYYVAVQPGQSFKISAVA